VLEHADDGTDLVCAFYLSSGEMLIEISATTATPPVPDLDSFAWQVLTTLATSADITSDNGRFTVSMSLTSSAVGAGL